MEKCSAQAPCREGVRYCETARLVRYGLRCVKYRVLHVERATRKRDNTKHCGDFEGKKDYGRAKQHEENEK